MAWLGKDEKTKVLLDRLKALVSSEERLVVAVTYSTTQRTDQTTQRMEKTAGRIEVATNETKQGVQQLNTNVLEGNQLSHQIDGKVDHITGIVESKCPLCFVKTASEILAPSDPSRGLPI